MISIAINPDLSRTLIRAYRQENACSTELHLLFLLGKRFSNTVATKSFHVGMAPLSVVRSIMSINDLGLSLRVYNVSQLFRGRAVSFGYSGVIERNPWHRLVIA